MDYGTVGQLIGTLGFPIVMTLLMAWYVKYITDQHREDTTQRDEVHRQEVTEITSALNNNTLVLQKLVDILQDDAEVINNGHVQGN